MGHVNLAGLRLHATVEVHAPGYRPERHALSAEGCTLGSGPGADIVPQSAASLAPAHLSLSPRASGCDLRVLTDAAPAFEYEGARYRSVVVPWEREIFVEGIRLTVYGNPRFGPKLHPAITALVACCLMLAAVHLVRSRHDVAETSTDVPPPPLLPERPSCPRSNLSRAQHLAEQAEAGARSKRERSAFSAGDGAEALWLYHRAAACYLVAGSAADAERLTRLGRSWNTHLEETYAALRLRLRLALGSDRHEEAVRAIRALESLLVHQRANPYPRWLSQLRRRLESELRR